jgi:hypothetical protein
MDRTQMHVTPENQPTNSIALAIFPLPSAREWHFSRGTMRKGDIDEIDAQALGAAFAFKRVLSWARPV